MTYPPVIQFETRALEAEARTTLAREQRAARAARPIFRSWRGSEMRRRSRRVQSAGIGR
jgi:hypothetical protein